MNWNDMDMGDKMMVFSMSCIGLVALTLVAFLIYAMVTGNVH